MVKQKKEYKKINSKIVVVTLLLVLLLIYLFMFDFSKRVDFQMRDMTTEHLEDINNQSVKAVNAEFDRVLNEICYTADYISQTPELTEDARNLLYEQLREKCGFSGIGLADADGNLYNTKHELLPKSDTDYVDALRGGASGMTDIFFSPTTGSEVFAFYAPFLRNGQPDGGLVGIMATEHMVDRIISTGFKNSSYTYILKPDGTVIMQSTHPDSLYDGRNYLDFLRNNTTAVTFSVEELQKKMETNDKGTFLFRMGEEQRLSYYTPSGINNWYVVTEVSYDISNAYQTSINLTALYLTLKIIALFVLLAVFIFISFGKAQKIVLDSKSDLELEKKKLEVSLRHASNTTFEYIPQKDLLTFITPPQIKEASFPVSLSNISSNAVAYGLVSDDYMESWQTLLSESAQGKTVESMEFTGGVLFKEDTWFRLSMSPVKNSSGEVIDVIGTMEDITDEQNIKKHFAQEEQYRTALLSRSVIMCSVNLSKQEVIAYSVTGIDKMEGRDSFPYNNEFIQRMCRRVHPNDYERIFNLVQSNNMLAAFYTEKREFKELIRTTYAGTDEYRWVSCTISLMAEPTTGAPIAFAYVMDVDEETRQRLDLAYSSERDPLTGLYNRRNIAERVDKALKGSESLSCLMIMDLDNFKGINDNYGHQEGDDVLKNLANILTRIFRSDDLSARLGGDEFIVFMDGLPNRECAYARANDICHQVYAMNISDTENHTSISIGLAFGHDDGDTFGQLYEHADIALYSAKGKGKNQIAVFQNEGN